MTSRRLVFVMFLLAAAFSQGCSSCTDFDGYSFGPRDGGGGGDGGTPDAGPGNDAGFDAGPDYDAGPIDAGGFDAGAMVIPSTNFAQTSGGGNTSSTSYRMRVTIGAPQPMGTTSSTGNRARLGHR